LTLILVAWYFYGKKLSIPGAEKLGIALPRGNGASGGGQEEWFWCIKR